MHLQSARIPFRWSSPSPLDSHGMNHNGLPLLVDWKFQSRQLQPEHLDGRATECKVQVGLRKTRRPVFG